MSVVVVMHNITFHKIRDIEQSIKNSGHMLLYLSVYQPELNPIKKEVV